MQAPPRKRRITLALVSKLWLACSLAILLTEHLLGEHGWFAMFITYVPQQPYAFIALFLLLASLRKKRPIWIGVNLVSLGIATYLLQPYFNLTGPVVRADIKVLSLNIKHGDLGWEEIGAFVEREKPDIIAFQEAEQLEKSTQLPDAFEDSLRPYTFLSLGELCVATKLPVLRTRSSDLDRIDMKKAQSVWLEFEGQELRIINVHLAPLLGDYFVSGKLVKMPEHLRITGRIRTEQIKRLTALARSEDTPTICLGDFNGPAIGPLYRELAEHFTDSFADVGSGFGYTIPAVFPVKRIDYIFTRGPVKAVQCWVLKDVVSDHLGVEGTFMIRG